MSFSVLVLAVWPAFGDWVGADVVPAAGILRRERPFPRNSPRRDVSAGASPPLDCSDV